MAEGEPSRLKKVFLKLRDSGRAKDFLVFLVFVFVAAAFWFILTLNDEVQDSYEVTVKIDNVPDSVTFINNVPSEIHVSVKDRGMNLLKYEVTGNPVLHLSFDEYAKGNVFRVSPAELNSSLRSLLGTSTSITSVDPDSIGLVFTRQPGKKVPVELIYEVSVTPGLVLSQPKLSPDSVYLYSVNSQDTISRLYTEKVVLADLGKNLTENVNIIQPYGKRVEPSQTEVTFNVEQLVKKEASVAVEAKDVPGGEDILFFPSKVKVTYYVPISKYNETDDGIRVSASFKDAMASTSDKVTIKVIAKASYINKIELAQDNVEYTIVKNI